MSASPSAEWPLYNVTYSTGRLSPLYYGDTPLNNQSLLIHASRFHEILVGGILRGVHVKSEEDAEIQSRAGDLTAVLFRTLTDERHWIQDNVQREQDPSLPGRSDRGIYIIIAYERAQYRAVMLRDVMSNRRAPGGASGFENYPLLLTRMPTALMVKLVDYLVMNFDARFEELYFKRNFLVGTLDMYAKDLKGPYHASESTGESLDEDAARIMKNISVECGRPNGSGALRTFTLHFKEMDISRFLAQKNEPELNGYKGAPLIANLARHISQHTAVNILHPALLWEKVACAAFVLGPQKIKFSVPNNNSQQFASWQLLCALVTEAATTGVNGA